MIKGLWTNNILGNPYIINVEDNYAEGGKLSHDSYRVYVNRDYVGEKVLVAQGEDVKDINGFLKTQGVTEFTANLEGNDYRISCGDDSSNHVKEVLNVYLNIR